MIKENVHYAIPYMLKSKGTIKTVSPDIIQTTLKNNMIKYISDNKLNIVFDISAVLLDAISISQLTLITLQKLLSFHGYNVPPI